MYYRDGRQLLVQSLFEFYSGLDFTRPTDRPVALLGLQKRMAQAFRARAAYGMFSVYFARGLLWKSADAPDRYMVPIEWAPGHYVPTWSWLSKLGAITYLETRFKTVEWATSDFKNPLMRNTSDNNEENYGEGVLVGIARPVVSSVENVPSLITFDLKNDYDYEKLRCIVIGRDKLDTYTTVQKYYVIIVYPNDDNHDDEFYERVGVATLRACHIGNEGSWVKVI